MPQRRSSSRTCSPRGWPRCSRSARGAGPSAASGTTIAYAAGWRSRVALGVPAGLGLALLVLPLLALLLRADWARLAADLTRPTALLAPRLALTTTTTVVLCLLLGTPLAWLLARSDHPAVRWVRALVTVPLVLPPSWAASPC